VVSSQQIGLKVILILLLARDSYSVQAAACRDTNEHVINMVSRDNSPCHPNYREALAVHLTMSLTFYF
jgi:hypothetical protein